MKINLQTYGEIECSLPSLAICYDIVSMWSGNQDRNIMGRLCSLAICVGIKDRRFPQYTIKMTDPIGYGGKCLDFLLVSGVPVNQIIEHGLQLITWYAQMLPSEEDVNTAENFTEQPPREMLND